MNWIEDGYLPEEAFTQTTVRRIDITQNLDYATKVDRRPAFVERLREMGRREAERFRQR